MRCPIETPEGSELLLAYSAHKLDAAAASTLDDHLRACERCREFTRAQREVWEALDGWSPQPVSAEFDRRLYMRIEQETGWWTRFLRPLRPMLAPRGLPAAVAACL